MSPDHALFPEPPPDPRVPTYLRDSAVACSRCGFDLREATHEVCPECGTRHHLDDLMERAYRRRFISNCSRLGVGAILALTLAMGSLWPEFLPLAMGLLVLAMLQATAIVVLIRTRHRLPHLPARTRRVIDHSCFVPTMILFLWFLASLR